TRTPSGKAYGVVPQHGVDSLDAVDGLSYPQVDRDAGERQRDPALDSVLAGHQREHALDGDLERVIEILVEAERHPRVRGQGDRPFELQVLRDGEGQRRLDRTLDGGAAHLAVTLPRVPVAGGEERAVDGDG